MLVDWDAFIHLYSCDVSWRADLMSGGFKHILFFSSTWLFVLNHLVHLPNIEIQVSHELFIEMYFSVLLTPPVWTLPCRLNPPLEIVSWCPAWSFNMLNTIVTQSVPHRVIVVFSNIISYYRTLQLWGDWRSKWWSVRKWTNYITYSTTKQQTKLIIRTG